MNNTETASITLPITWDLKIQDLLTPLRGYEQSASERVNETLDLMIESASLNEGNPPDAQNFADYFALRRALREILSCLERKDYENFAPKMAKFRDFGGMEFMSHCLFDLMILATSAGSFLDSDHEVRYAFLSCTRSLFPLMMYLDQNFPKPCKN